MINMYKKNSIKHYLKNNSKQSNSDIPKEVYNRAMLSTKLKSTVSQTFIKNNPLTIRVSYSWCKITTMSPALLELDNHFKIFNEQARFSKYFRGNGGSWDGFVHFINIKDGTFGIGLLKEVVNYLALRGIPYKIQDVRVDEQGNNIAYKEPCYNWKWKGHELRPEQVEAVDALKRDKLGILKLPTAFGKTECFLKLICGLGRPTLITVPTAELMRQTARRAEAAIYGAKIGMFGDGVTPHESDQIIVATLKSLLTFQAKITKNKFIESMAAFDVLVSDECHKIISGNTSTKTWEMIMQIPASYRFGISATPFEDPKCIAAMYLKQSFGNISYTMDMTDARDKGIVVPFNVYVYNLDYPAFYGLTDYSEKDWREAHEEYICSNETRNKHIVNVAAQLVRKGHKVLIVAQRIPHNDLITEKLNELLPDIEVFQFNGKTRNRDSILMGFSNLKEPSIMVASSIANDGIDIKDITALIVAHGGKSYFQTVQRIGRGLRTNTNKDKLIVVDYNDSQLGTWFKKHYQERKKRYIELGGFIFDKKNFEEI